MPIAKSCASAWASKKSRCLSGDLRNPKNAVQAHPLLHLPRRDVATFTATSTTRLANPGFGGEVLQADGCCCILFATSDQPDTVRQLLLDEIEQVRKGSVDREDAPSARTKIRPAHRKSGKLVEDSASQMADFALAGQTVAQQITMLAGLTAEDADAALQHILRLSGWP